MSHSGTMVGARTVRSVRDLPVGHPAEFAGLSISPAEQVQLLLARKKQQGITDWERVWPWAVKRIRWPHDRDERWTWKHAIDWAEPVFRAAYCGDPLLVDMSALVRIIGVA